MTESQGSGAPALEEIRFRLGIWQRVLPWLPLAVCVLPVAVLRVITDVRPVFEPSLLVLWIVLVLVTLAVPFGITLTPSAARVHGFRSRTIPWASVQCIRIEKLGGSRIITLYEADGRRTRLRAPTTGFLQWDCRFEEKFHVIDQWWLAHRGADGVPAPPSWAPLAPGGSATPSVPVAPPVPPTS
ncbi:hypothetical protein OG930_16555 [Streptomyces sp. NBC_01799]|uniref:hypothetical protein n=1 Tax=Streptomyces sp. NBC_01800 TaxID=2975945 RepID=UPI002DD85729|nr:hypothetical protein [Streptomyces sp. NBC_01800]WSA68469.1 hypothetical protein OIE65_16580 [Streptomyces sp. NBC_01800]WSA77081.1 hypothetical protein OG930_16555 [Streptomyces sp. NBC_01799]